MIYRRDLSLWKPFSVIIDSLKCYLFGTVQIFFGVEEGGFLQAEEAFYNKSLILHLRASE